MAGVEEIEQSSEKNLNELYLSGLNILEDIENNSNLQFNSLEFQLKVKQGITHLENATKLINLVGMFSANETVEEIATENLQYLLLPFYLGQLVQKIYNDDRQTNLQTSKTYFKDFIERCGDYEIVQVKGQTKNQHANADDKTLQSLLNAASSRNAKIENYRRMKEFEEQIKTLKSMEQNGNVDDEVKRDLYLKEINHAFLKAQEEIISIDQELEILEFRKLSSNDKKPPKNNQNLLSNSHVSRTSFKPIIITKDVAQKAVFGLGYPSVPVMTVAEFYDERVKRGEFPEPGSTAKKLSPENEDEKEEKAKAENDILEDNDDEEYLARMRARDEYKDVVRRGDGNRYNRS